MSRECGRPGADRADAAASGALALSHVPQLYAAIGDSFTEGVGDELPDGSVRGWADFVALGLAAAAHEPIGYANLAIRGRKLGPIVDEQLEMAIALHPEVISFNGGGNDMLRPRMPEERVADRFRQAVHRIRGAGIHVLMLSGANPTDHLLLGRVFDARGVRLTAALGDLAQLDGVTFVDNFNDRGLRDIRYWSPDKLHLNSLGHARREQRAHGHRRRGSRRVGRRRGRRRAARASQPQHRRVLPRVRAAVDRASPHGALSATGARRSGDGALRSGPHSSRSLRMRARHALTQAAASGRAEHVGDERARTSGQALDALELVHARHAPPTAPPDDRAGRSPGT